MDVLDLIEEKMLEVPVMDVKALQKAVEVRPPEESQPLVVEIDESVVPAAQVVEIHINY